MKPSEKDIKKVMSYLGKKSAQKSPRPKEYYQHIRSIGPKNRRKKLSTD